MELNERAINIWICNLLILKDKLMLKILPFDIDTSSHFYDSFGNMETEVSARWIVEYCQQSNTWARFSHADILRFYNSGITKHVHRFNFNNLDDPKYLVERDGYYTVTDKFITTCYGCRPAQVGEINGVKQ